MRQTRGRRATSTSLRGEPIPLRRTWPGILLLLAAASSSALIAGPLLPGQMYEAGEHPSSIVVADFNRDGHLDLAVVNTASDDRSVLLGRGDGTFGRQRTYAAGPQPHAVVSSDFNGDGIADLAVVHQVGVSTFLGQGDGTFVPLETYFIGINPHAAAAGDFNHDGFPDLLVSNSGQYLCTDVCTCQQASLSVLINLGNGRFVQQDLPLAGQNCAAELAVADFDQDGNEDVVVTENTYGNPSRDNLSFLPGHGDGTFGPESRLPGIQLGTSAGTGDFNEDGKPDLVVASGTGSGITILRGMGGGQFASGATYPSDGGVNGIAVGDLDGDGHLDVIVANSHDGVNRYLGHGDATFSSLPALTAGKWLAQPALGDFNGDHLLDVAVVSTSHSPGIAILPGRGAGELRAGLPPLPLSAGSRALVSADFNRDQRPDLAVVNETSRSLTLFTGNGDGTFRAASQSRTGYYPYALAAGDLDGDGNFDIAVANLGSSDVSVLIGSGGGSFNTLPAEIPTGNLPRGIAIGRFDAGPVPDLVTANQGSGDISILRGLGFGQFAPQIRYPVHSTYSSPFSAATGDFDRDGFDDVAVATYTGCNCVSLFRSRGDGTFTVSGEPPAGGLPTYVTAADLDRDGRLDLAITNGMVSGGQVSVLRGRGDGSFEDVRSYGVGDEPLALAVADFNGDGLPDLVAADRGSNDVAVLLATAPGRYNRPLRFLVGTEPWSIAAGDFNGDGRPDVAVLDYISSDVRILLNQGPTNHPPVARIATAASVECSSPSGANVLLDASASTDPDSTPGTNDDIISFQWYGDYGGPSETYLGSGEQLEVTLPLGAHSVTLVATDSAGAVDIASTLIQIADTTPPLLAVRLSRTLLWPPDRRMVDILADVHSADACGDPAVLLLGITSNESGDDPGSSAASSGPDIQGADFGTLDLHFQLRAARRGGGSGRIYTVTYQATDLSGNVSTVDSFVYVPGSLSPAERPASPVPTRSR